jgi:dUTP pyrophosphatase
MKLNVKILNENVREFYTADAANFKLDSGYDLYASETINIPARTTGKIKFGIACENKVTNPCGYFLMPRSSIYKTPLRICNCVGLIDYLYRGEIMAIVDNNSDKDYEVKLGDRLFQLVAPSAEPWTIEIVDELSSTERGAGGFGSTDAKPTV